MSYIVIFIYRVAPDAKRCHSLSPTFAALSAGYLYLPIQLVFCQNFSGNFLLSYSCL